MFCSKCGSQISEEQAFCGNCGAPVREKRTDENVFAQMQMSNKKMVMHCPRCGNTGLQAQVSNRITSSSSSASKIGKNFAIGSTTYNSITETFWLCPTCGMKFRDLDELHNIIVQLRKYANRCKKLLIISAIVYFLLALYCIFGCNMGFITLIILMIVYLFIPLLPIGLIQLWAINDAKNKEMEYNNLLPKVRRMGR